MSATDRADGKLTLAFSVARLTLASTPSSLLSLRSTRAEQEAHVIPLIARSTCCALVPTVGFVVVLMALPCDRGIGIGRVVLRGSDAGGVARLLDGGAGGAHVERAVGVHEDVGVATLDQVLDPDVQHALDLLHLLGDGGDAVAAGHAGDDDPGRLVLDR